MNQRDRQLLAWQEHLEAVSWQLDRHELSIRELPESAERSELAVLNERSRRLVHESMEWVERQLRRPPPGAPPLRPTAWD